MLLKKEKAWFLFLVINGMPRTSSPSLLMSTKYQVQIREKNYLYCNFPFLFWVVKYFLCCFQIGSTDVIYYMTQNFLHGIEISLENTSSLKRFSTLKATLEKTVFTVICLEIKSALIVGSSIVKKDV